MHSWAQSDLWAENLLPVLYLQCPDTPSCHVAFCCVFWNCLWQKMLQKSVRSVLFDKKMPGFYAEKHERKSYSNCHWIAWSVFVPCRFKRCNKIKRPQSSCQLCVQKEFVDKPALFSNLNMFSWNPCTILASIFLPWRCILLLNDQTNLSTFFCKTKESFMKDLQPVRPKLELLRLWNYDQIIQVT